jgi:hypothetical protein
MTFYIPLPEDTLTMHDCADPEGIRLSPQGSAIGPIMTNRLTQKASILNK